MLDFLTSLGLSPGFIEFFTISLLNGISYGLLLFMLSSGLTLIFSMMGVLNFAHASFYMLGAYVAFTVTAWLGFWWALLLAPLFVGLLGAGFEKFLSPARSQVWPRSGIADYFRTELHPAGTGSIGVGSQFR